MRDGNRRHQDRGQDIVFPRGAGIPGALATTVAEEQRIGDINASTQRAYPSTEKTPEDDGQHQQHDPTEYVGQDNWPTREHSRQRDLRIRTQEHRG